MKRRRLAVEKQVTLTESTMTIDQLQRSAKQKGSTPLNSDQAGKLLELASRLHWVWRLSLSLSQLSLSVSMSTVIAATASSGKRKCHNS